MNMCDSALPAEKPDDRFLPGQGSRLLMVAAIHGPRPGRGMGMGNGERDGECLPCKKRILTPRQDESIRHTPITHRLPRAHCSRCSELPRA